MQIPADTDNIPPDLFFDGYKSMVSKIEGFADVNEFNFRDFIDRHRGYIIGHGFDYLSNAHNYCLVEEIDDATQKGIRKLNNGKFMEIYNLWREVHDKRENQMLQKIYN